MSSPNDKPGEACGVFGIRVSGDEAARLTYFGLFALQHRGQESAGIAVSDGTTQTVYKDTGLVAQVFTEPGLAALTGHLAIGHTRYSTTGSSNWANAQPIYREVNGNGVSLSHNGNLINTAELAAEYGQLFATTDSELMSEAISQHMRKADTDLVTALLHVLPSFQGAFTLTILDNNNVIGVRDPMGFRPLSLGKLGDGWVLASETAALDILGASFFRDVEPGEMVVLTDDGVRSYRPFETSEHRLCLFEFVYFARPDSMLMGSNVHAARRRMGEQLADQAPVVADITVPVPESGIPAAQGYAARSGIPLVDGLIKNRYVGRTFIDPAQSMRDRGIHMKLNPLRQELEGKRVVLIDDSIVRGSTTKQLISMVRDAGAIEVHLRISSPPYRWPCFYGMDTGDRSSLLAADKSEDEIAKYLDVDSLGYLKLDRLIAATNLDSGSFCTACLSGEYPTPIPLDDPKFILEHAE